MTKKKKIATETKTPVELLTLVDENQDDFTKEHKYKVRLLTQKDNRKLRSLITKYSEAVGSSELMEIKSSEGEESQGGEDMQYQIFKAAFNLFTEMLQVIETDITEWFADLIGVSLKEYENLPFDIEMDIITDIITQKDFKNFFLKGSLVFSSIKALVNRIRK